jgi:hypothetical protein
MYYLKQFNFFFLAVLGFELKDFMIVRQALCHFSYASSTFGSGYFGARLSLFAQASLDHNPILCLPPSLG